jgi:hypothetical protein
MVDESREPRGKPDQAGVGMRSMKERSTNGSGNAALRGIQGNLGPTRLERADSNNARLYRAMKLEGRQPMEAPRSAFGLFSMHVRKFAGNNLGPSGDQVLAGEADTMPKPLSTGDGSRRQMRS